MRGEVPGMGVPDRLSRRRERAGDEKKKREAEGIAICVEIIEEVRKIPGLAGFHIMPIAWESAVARISRDAHLSPATAPPASPSDEPVAASVSLSTPAASLLPSRGV